MLEKIKKAFGEFNEYGNTLKVAKIFVALFFVVLVVDGINVPTDFIKEHNFMSLIFIIVGAIILSILFAIGNHILSLLKLPSFNELDVSMVMATVCCLTYTLVLLLIPSMYHKYKIIIICIVLSISIIVLVGRMIYYGIKLNSKVEKNTNVFDLLDFIELDIKEFNSSNELPILFSENDVEYDLLDRSVIINKLYASILACKGVENSFVIGIEGPWGVGKTTIVKNVIKRIVDGDNQDFITVADFDPWIYSTPQALLIALFDEILKSVGINYSKSSFKKIATNMVKGIIGINAVSNLAGKVVFDSDVEDDINKLKEQISTCLERNNKTLVVFVDNLDRASKSNVSFLMKIINSIFDLKRVVYVLSYNKNRLNNLLSPSVQLDEHFAEKIIQQEICVPKLNYEKFKIIVNDCLNKFFEIYGLTVEEKNSFNFIADYFAEHTRNVREFKRLMNSIGTTVSTGLGLSKTDLFTLEIVKFINSDLYNEIQENPEYFISADQDKNLDIYHVVFNREKFNKDGKAFFDSLKDTFGQELLILLSNVFPYVEKYLNGSELRGEFESNDKNKEIELKCGAASAKYFDLYFNYGTNEYIVISNLFNSFLDLIKLKSSTPEIIPDIFDKYIKNMPSYYHYEFFAKLWFARFDLDESIVFNALLGMIRNINKLNKERGFFSLSAYQRACIIMADWFSLLSNEEKETFLESLNGKYLLIGALDEMFYWIKSDKNRRRKDNDVEMFQSLLNKLCKEAMDEPIDILSDSNYAYHNIWAVLRARKRIENLDDEELNIRDYIRVIMKPQHVYRLLSEVIGESIGSKGYGYSFSNNIISMIIPSDEDVFQWIEQCPPSNDIERFLSNVWKNYIYGTDDEDGDRAIFSDNPVNFW